MSLDDARQSSPEPAGPGPAGSGPAGTGPADAGPEAQGTGDAGSADSGQKGPSPLEQFELREITDARTMRALSHPVRIAIVEELSLGGAMTATEVGELIGESPTTCSFHLRQLAKYGWVEEAGGGKGRARPWRMTSLGFSTPSASDPDTDIAASTLNHLFRERQLARYENWTKTRSAFPRRWREVVPDTEYIFFLTPDELEQLNRDLQAAILPWFQAERITDPSQRPPGSLPVELLTLGYPIELPKPESPGAESPGTEPPSDQ